MSTFVSHGIAGVLLSLALVAVCYGVHVESPVVTTASVLLFFTGLRWYIVLLIREFT